jgi:ferredoxin--NADP+ reductase
VAAHILKDVAAGGKPGRPALEAILAKKGVTPVTYPDWKTIEAAEIAAASPGAPRRKFARVAEMLSLLGRPG